MSGRPTDPHQFIELLQGHSCNPIATRRILEELEAGKTKLTTVSDFLPFNDIGDKLAALGVTLQIVPPFHRAPDQRYDHAAFDLITGAEHALDEFSAEERDRIHQIRAQTLDSLARVPHGFGRFLR